MIQEQFLLSVESSPKTCISFLIKCVCLGFPKPTENFNDLPPPKYSQTTGNQRDHFRFFALWFMEDFWSHAGYDKGKRQPNNNRGFVRRIL